MTSIFAKFGPGGLTRFSPHFDGQTRRNNFIPLVPAAKITDLAKALMGEKKLQIVYTGIRPGEKVHEIMVSEEECFRTIKRGDYYVILPVLPELRAEKDFVPALKKRIFLKG